MIFTANVKPRRTIVWCLSWAPNCSSRSLKSFKLAVAGGFPSVQLGDDVRRKLIFEKRQPVAQREFSLLEPLDLQPVAGTKLEQCVDRGIEVAMLLTQTLEFGQQ